MPGLIAFLLGLNPRINPAYPTASQGPTLTVPANVADHSITYPKIQEVSANVVLGGVEAGTVVEIPMTGAGRSLVAADSVNAQRSVLGVSVPVTEAQLQLSDVPTWDASTTAHGFLKKLNGNVSTFLDGSGNFSVPPGSGGNVSGPGSSTNLALVTWSGTTGSVLLDNPNATFNGNTSQFLNRSGNFSVPPSGSGNVSGPGSSTDRAIATWNGTGGTTLRDNSAATIDASGNISTTGKIAATGNVTGANLGNVTPTNLNGNASTYLNGSGNFTVASAKVLITETVTSGSQGNVTFSSIASTYRDLEIRVRGRGDGSGGTADRNISLQFNGDTGSNYNWTLGYLVNSTASGASSASDSKLIAGLLPAAGSTANYAGVMDIVIPDYKTTTFFKSAMSHGGHAKTSAVADHVSLIGHGNWLSTAAITDIKVFFGDGGNFVDGSVVSLYGHY